MRTNEKKRMPGRRPGFFCAEKTFAAAVFSVAAVFLFPEDGICFYFSVLISGRIRTQEMSETADSKRKSAAEWKK